MSSPSGSPGSPRLFLFSALRFHGKNGWMSVGTLPPAAAQCSKYHVSHFRGLSFHMPTWPRSRTTPPSVDHSRVTPSRRSSSAPPPGPAPVAPSCYCPSGSAGRPRTASAPPNVPRAFQSLPARRRKIRSGQFRLHLRFHRGDGLRRQPSASPNAVASCCTAKRRSLSR